ncbi:MAG: hypothetical protein JNK57_01590 [Planctomycetaceae bacterium]|jgi:hypothetical protein|nr:hypothetical protein [Planctomycetaceae bacterium]
MSNPMPGSPGYPYQPPTAPKSGGSSVLKIVLIVFAVLGLGCVCCAAGGYYLWGLGMGELSKLAAAEASQNQTVKDNYGELEAGDVNVNLIASGQMQEKFRREVLVFDAEGPLGSGQLVFETAGGNKQGIGKLIAIEIDGELVELE